MPKHRDHGFEPSTTQDLPALNIQAQVFTHPCGMQHVHLGCQDPELAFSIAFPTRPDNDTGVAHALEHLVLCGSRRYPVRDPFFNMLRRSLATYANAQTGPDHTRFPFSTINQQDYWNMMDVYLDAVFHPILDLRDFDQEAVRLVGEIDGGAAFDGVVFNEMLGARSSPMSMLATTLAQAVASGTPFERDFGGAPTHIPDLTHQALADFHRQHYQPGAALVVTYGDIDPRLIQARLAGVIPAGHTGPDKAPIVADDSAWPAHKTIQWPQEKGHNDRYLWARLWELPSDNSGQRLWSGAMTGLLCEDGQPLAVALDSIDNGQRVALGSTSFGSTVALVAVMDGLSETDVARCDAIVEEAVAASARAGVDPARIAKVREDVEMVQRSTAREGGMGKGLQLISDLMERWAWSGRVDLDAIDLDKALALATPELNEAGFEAFCAHLGRTRSTRLKGVPDPDFFERRRKALDEMANARWQAMDKQAQVEHQHRLSAMSERQSEPQDSRILPILGLDQAGTRPLPNAPIAWEAGTAGRAARARLEAPLHGLVDVSVALDMANLTETQAPWLSLAMAMWPKMPVGTRNWMQSEQWRELLPSTPGLQLSHAPRLDDPTHNTIELGLSGTALAPRAADMRDGLCEALFQTRFDDVQRLHFLVEQELASRRRHMDRYGPGLAQRRALAWLGPHKALGEAVGGAAWLELLANVRDALGRGEHDPVINRLEAVMEWAREQPAVTRLCAEPGHADTCWRDEDLALFRSGWVTPQRQQARNLFPGLGTPEQIALVSGEHLSFAYMALQGPTPGSLDEAAMGVACELLQSQFLHGALRERGGAYGSSMRSGDGLILLSSYRDPRLAGTLEDFERARGWLENARITPGMLHEAILARMSNLDRPEAPMMTAFRSWERTMAGVDETMRIKLRKQTLDMDINTIRTACARWLGPTQPTARVVFTGEQNASEAVRCGLEIEAISIRPPENRHGPRAGM